MGEWTETAIRHPPADEHDGRLGRQDTPQRAEGAAARDVDQEVVANAASREVLPGVVHDAVRAE